jgi:hypothetical protein
MAKVQASTLRFWCKQHHGVESSDLTDMAKRKAIEELFKGRHFEKEIIIFCVRWYLRFKLSSRDLAVSHTTILRWVQRFVP